MPRGDGSGPMGQGSMTGRGAGFCSGFSMPGFSGRGMNKGIGRGIRQGFGRGSAQGFGRGQMSGMPYNSAYQNFAQPTTMNREQETEYLKNQAKYMETELSEIKDRVNEIGNAKK